MDRFNSGDIIPVKTLNEVDGYIKQLYELMGSEEIVKKLYNAWQGIQTGDKTTSISDEIQDILDKQRDYINP